MSELLDRFSAAAKSMDFGKNFEICVSGDLLTKYGNETHEVGWVFRFKSFCVFFFVDTSNYIRL